MKRLNNIRFLTVLNTFLLSITLFTILTTTSCVSSSQSTVKPSDAYISRSLTDAPVKNEDQLYYFFISNNPNADKEMIKRLCTYYVEEGKIEGINSDCAFAQMCLETGFLRFGGLVTPDMHNYCGLGSMDKEHPGERFESERMGVRAHIQHLHAYATTEDKKLKNTCIDNRYKYVKPRGKAPTIYELSGTWAMDKEYANKINGLLLKLQDF